MHEMSERRRTVEEQLHSLWWKVSSDGINLRTPVTNPGDQGQHSHLLRSHHSSHFATLREGWLSTQDNSMRCCPLIVGSQDRQHSARSVRQIISQELSILSCMQPKYYWIRDTRASLVCNSFPTCTGISSLTVTNRTRFLEYSACDGFRLAAVLVTALSPPFIWPGESKGDSQSTFHVTFFSSI